MNTKALFALLSSASLGFFGCKNSSNAQSDQSSPIGTWAWSQNENVGFFCPPGEVCSGTTGAEAEKKMTPVISSIHFKVEVNKVSLIQICKLGGQEVTALAESPAEVTATLIKIKQPLMTKGSNDLCRGAGLSEPGDLPISIKNGALVIGNNDKVLPRLE